MIEVDSQAVTILISQLDRIGISEIVGLATERNNTYLTMRADAFDDYASRDVIAITDGNALLAVEYVADTEGIVLTTASFDLNRGTLSLTFSDIVNVSTFNLRDVILQNAERVPTQMFSLTGGDVTRSADALTITIALSTSNLNQLKSISTLATFENNTYVNIAQDTILDLADNGLDAAIRQVDVFIPDDTPPEIVSFSFDLNVGPLNLTFSETINISSFDPTWNHTPKLTDIRSV